MFEHFNDVFVGNVRLSRYLWYLINRRYFNKEKIVVYTKEIYDIDLTEHIDSLDDWCFETKKDMYAEFIEFNHNPIEDDGSREYFNKYGRQAYLDFLQNYLYIDIEEDHFTHALKANDVHHIYPLCYGGKSDIENLIYINSNHHEILHENPYENQKKFCYQAIDYLGSLYHHNSFIELNSKYHLPPKTR